jgi:hypothetical protein
LTLADGVASYHGGILYLNPLSMPSVNQYLRYIGQTKNRIEKLTSSVSVLRDQKKTAPKAKQASVTAKLKLAQEELKESKTKLKEHKDNMATANKAEKATVTKVPKKAGRPAKVAVAKAAPARKAGRPPKAKVAETAAPRKAGRPPKAKVAETAAPRKAGRPPKAKVAETAAPRKAGRPPKAKVAEVKAAAPARQAGRPAKVSTAPNTEAITQALELLSIKIDALAVLVSTEQPKNLSTAQLRVMRRGL